MRLSSELQACETDARFPESSFVLDDTKDIGNAIPSLGGLDILEAASGPRVSSGTSDVLLFDLDLAGDDLRIVLVFAGRVSLVKCRARSIVAAFRWFTATIWRL